MTIAAERTLHVKVRRSQKAGMLGGKPTFMLDARVALSAEDHGLVSKYGLGDLVVYDSKARRARDDQTSAAGHARHFFTGAAAGPFFPLTGFSAAGGCSTSRTGVATA